MAKPVMHWERRIGRRLHLRDLHILFAVVQCGGMAKAAAQLGVSQPSVSEAIANLEHAVGVQLLNRSQRGVEPTMYGEALLYRVFGRSDGRRTPHRLSGNTDRRFSSGDHRSAL